MSDFGEYVHIKKTRKPYRCIFCCRLIPAGNKGHGYKGIWQGDWQNWKCCDTCETRVMPTTEPGDGISKEDFDAYLEEAGYRDCPNGCQPANYFDRLCSYEWSEDEQNLIFTCKKCGAVRVVPYPYEESEGAV